MCQRTPWRKECRLVVTLVRHACQIERPPSFCGGYPAPRGGRRAQSLHRGRRRRYEDAELVEQAKNGDRAALEKLVLRHQAWIYNIAVRMVFQPHDAEEVTQEVLVKVITKLSTFKGESKFRTWLYRIAANHVLNMKRRSAETRVTTFADYGAAIDGTPDLDLPDPKSVPVEVPLLVEEAKNGCTMGMLLCLDRKQRLIFTLGEILGASDTVGGEVLEMTADNFRQCLARARRDLHSFMNNQCGLVNKNNPCRCPKKTRGFIEARPRRSPPSLVRSGACRASPGCRRRNGPRNRGCRRATARGHLTAITRFSSPRTRSTGFGACWKARTCAGRCI